MYTKENERGVDMEVRELKEEYTNKYNEELMKCGVFFAFGNEQFQENKTYKEDNNSSYISLGMGAYISEKDLEKYKNFCDIIAKDLKKDFITKVDKKDYILYELSNHECFYTGEIEDAHEVLKDYYKDITLEEIRQVYRDNKERFCD